MLIYKSLLGCYYSYVVLYYHMYSQNASLFQAFTYFFSFYAYYEESTWLLSKTQPDGKLYKEVCLNMNGTVSEYADPFIFRITVLDINVAS